MDRSEGGKKSIAARASRDAAITAAPILGDQLERLKRFAAARVDAVRWNAGPDHGFEPRWHPRLSGKNVSIQPTELKDRGYATRAEAVAAAQEFRELCRAALADDTGSERSEHRDAQTNTSLHSEEKEETR